MNTNQEPKNLSINNFDSNKWKFLGFSNTSNEYYNNRKENKEQKRARLSKEQNKHSQKIQQILNTGKKAKRFL